MSHPDKTVLWIERLERFAQSKMTVAAFCAAEKVSQASYYYWRRKLLGPSRQPISQQPKSDEPDSSQPASGQPKSRRPDSQQPNSQQLKSQPPKLSRPKPARRKRRNPANRTEPLAPHAFVPIALASPNEHPQQPTRALTTIELPSGIRVRIDVPTVPSAQSPSREGRA